MLIDRIKKKGRSIQATALRGYGDWSSAMRRQAP